LEKSFCLGYLERERERENSENLEKSVSLGYLERERENSEGLEKFLPLALRKDLCYTAANSEALLVTLSDTEHCHRMHCHSLLTKK